MKSFLARLFIFSAALGLIVLLLYFILPDNVLSPSLPFLIVYFFAITAVVYWVVIKAATHAPRKFVGYFMLATFVKLFIYVLTIFAYAYFNREDLFPFVIAFFILYVFYTVFEVVAVIKKTG